MNESNSDIRMMKLMSADPFFYFFVLLIIDYGISALPQFIYNVRGEKDCE